MNRTRPQAHSWFWLLAAAPALFLAAAAGHAAAPEEENRPPPREDGELAKATQQPVALNKQGTILLDLARKRLLLKTQVVLRQGQLELFCCLKQTKEHESILSLDGTAQAVHAGLLRLGAKPGTPVTFTPEYAPPTGQKIDIFVSWKDQAGKSHRERAQSWVRHSVHRFRTAKVEKLPAGVKLPENSELRYDAKLQELSWYGPMTDKQRDEFLALSEDKAFRKAIGEFHAQSQPREMKADWVFAGSGFYRDDQGKNHYLAEDGDLICVANFPGATIDVAIESTTEGPGLLFEAWTERIPPDETPVTIELVPVFEARRKPIEK